MMECDNIDKARGRGEWIVFGAIIMAVGSIL